MMAVHISAEKLLKALSSCPKGNIIIPEFHSLKPSVTKAHGVQLCHIINSDNRHDPCPMTPVPFPFFMKFLCKILQSLQGTRSNPLAVRCKRRHRRCAESFFLSFQTIQQMRKPAFRHNGIVADKSQIPPAACSKGNRKHEHAHILPKPYDLCVGDGVKIRRCFVLGTMV